MSSGHSTFLSFQATEHSSPFTDAGYGAYGAKPAAGYGAAATGYGQQAAGYGTQQAATGYGAAAAAQTGYGQQAAAGYGAAAQVRSLHVHIRLPTDCPKPESVVLCKVFPSVEGAAEVKISSACLLAESDVLAAVHLSFGKVFICVWGIANLSKSTKRSLQGLPVVKLCSFAATTSHDLWQFVDVVRSRLTEHVRT